jgi:hypothetical protein
MPIDLDELFNEYDELAADVARSNHTFFASNLKRWFDFLDRVSLFARPILQQLESAGYFPAWFEPYRIMMATGGGAEVFHWPEDRRQRLGMQLHLLRRMTGGEIDPGVFALTVLHIGSIHNRIAAIVDQIFVPLSRELRRYVKDQTASAAMSPPAYEIPPLEMPMSFGSETAAAEMLTLKPTLWGIGIDLKELGRRLKQWWRLRRAG